MNGNYLVVFVSIGIILPLSLLKNLGKDLIKLCVCVCTRLFIYSITIKLYIVQLFHSLLWEDIFLPHEAKHLRAVAAVCDPLHRATSNTSRVPESARSQIGVTET